MTVPLLLVHMCLPNQHTFKTCLYCIFKDVEYVLLKTDVLSNLTLI